MNVVRCKSGVQFAVIAPGGFRLLAAIDATAQEIGHDLTITSGTDGEHSGPEDPHYRGEAYDVRTQDLPDKQKALEILQAHIGPLFYAFIEDPGTPNEHIHCQVAKGTTFPPVQASAQAITNDLAS